MATKAPQAAKIATKNKGYCLASPYPRPPGGDTDLHEFNHIRNSRPFTKLSNLFSEQPWELKQSFHNSEQRPGIKTEYDGNQ